MIEIRPFLPTDPFDDLIALSRTFFTEYEAHHPDFFQIDKLQDDAIVGYFARWLDNEDGETFVAVSDACAEQSRSSRIIGNITIYIQDQPAYWHVKRIGHISGLMVDPAYRQQGIAGELLAAAQSFFRQKGVRFFTVYTAVANHPALQFYEKSGMSPLQTVLLGES